MEVTGAIRKKMTFYLIKTRTNTMSFSSVCDCLIKFFKFLLFGQSRLQILIYFIYFYAISYVGKQKKLFWEFKNVIFYA